MTIFDENIEQIKAWIEALRSGRFKQGVSVLETADHRFCCLGVACRIFIPPDKFLMTMHESNTHLSGTTPHDQPNAPNWLQQINSDFATKIEINDWSFIELNDTGRFTFDEIADLIQAVYIDKVLE
jgi:hypothetical protein